MGQAAASDAACMSAPFDLTRFALLAVLDQQAEQEGVCDVWFTYRR
jgi:hypothetical protein